MFNGQKTGKWETLVAAAVVRVTSKRVKREKRQKSHNKTHGPQHQSKPKSSRTKILTVELAIKFLVLYIFTLFWWVTKIGNPREHSKIPFFRKFGLFHWVTRFGKPLERLI